jgi:hypothetical protein
MKFKVLIDEPRRVVSWGILAGNIQIHTSTWEDGFGWRVGTLFLTHNEFALLRAAVEEVESNG